ncbi:MAG: hypothetical protein ACI9VT_004188 [Psychroserpens sp.]|jgi:hypothetical protein
MSETITINQRFNGSPTAGNDGYSCGLLAARLTGPAKVRLYAPAPLNKPLALTVADSLVQMHDGDTLIGQAEAFEFELNLPMTPTLACARDASARYPCKDKHIYQTCFVCGTHRCADDALCLYPGPVTDWSLLACVWQPNASLLNSSGDICDEYIWAALDCPGYFAAVGENLRIALLGELNGKILASISGDQELVVFSWPLGRDGRNLYSGVAIANAQGQVLAYSHTTWIKRR